MDKEHGTREPAEGHQVDGPQLRARAGERHPDGLPGHPREHSGTTGCRHRTRAPQKYIQVDSFYLGYDPYDAAKSDPHQSLTLYRHSNQMQNP